MGLLATAGVTPDACDCPLRLILYIVCMCNLYPLMEGQAAIIGYVCALADPTLQLQRLVPDWALQIMDSGEQEDQAA